jgi:DnaK suppressor protein
MKNSAQNSPTPDFRQMLLAKRAQVLAGLSAQYEGTARLGRVAEDDQAQICHEEFIWQRRNRLDYQQMKLVDEALERIETGDYGICTRCEEPIAAKRLQALPWAQYCVACQEAISNEELSAEYGSRPAALVG